MMRTELDRRMDEGIARLTGPGGPLPLGTAVSHGATVPMIVGLPTTLGAYFAHYAAEHASSCFLVAGDERLTFAEVHAHAGAVAAALVARGIAVGDRVGIAMRNSPSWIAVYMGVVIAGGVATLLNGWWRSDEMATALGDVACRIVVADPPRADRLRGIVDGAALVTIDDAQPLGAALAALVGSAVAGAAFPELTGTDEATILFTSGSTGRSRGAISDHRAVLQGVFNYLAQALVMVGIATEDGRPPVGQPATLLNVPLFHVTAEVPVLLQSFAMGRKLVLMAKWDAEEAMRLIEREHVTYFVGVPLMSFEMLTHPARARYDLSSVTDFAAGGAPRPVDHVRRLDAEMGGGKPLIGYGLTETNAVGSGNWRGNYLAKPDSAGRASAPLVDLAILDGSGLRVPPFGRGEVAIRSVCNFRGYDGDPDATRGAFTGDGYFLTGDIGYLDEDGYLFIVDRKKDIIIRGGENISCHEVEAAIYRHPLVAEAAVFGLPDERLGEVPGAVVHLRGPGLDAAGLVAFLEPHIAAFKMPQRIWFSDDRLPRLGTEKIDKVALRAEYRALAKAALPAAAFTAPG